MKEKSYKNVLNTVSKIEESLNKLKLEIDKLYSMIEKEEIKLYGDFEPPPAVEYIKFMMDNGGLKQIDLINIFGSKSRVSEFLSEKRKLSKTQMEKLHKILNVPYEILHRGRD